MCSTSTSANYLKYVEFDAADRPVADYWFSIDHDELNRVESLPALSTQNSTDTSMGYYVNDMNRTITQGSTVRTWTLDPAGRDRKATISTSSAATLNHFSDASSDSPDWTQETSSTGSTSRTTYNSDLNGQLASVTSNAGGSTPAIEYQFTNIHGDITNTYVPGSGVLSSTMDADEYGRMRDSAGANAVGAKYGWLGGKQRAAEADSGIVRMGVRLYSPLLGIFLQTDPVLGGSASPYAYPSDPITQFDLDGRWWKPKLRHIFTAAVVTLTVVSMFTCTLCVAVGYGLAAYSAYQAGYKTAKAVRTGRGWNDAALSWASVGSFGVARWARVSKVGKHSKKRVNRVAYRKSAALQARTWDGALAAYNGWSTW